MPVIAKFIVANEENAYKVAEMANAYYMTSKQKDTEKENTVSALLNKANSFTREWLMSVDVTGENEDRIEELLALLVLQVRPSSKLYKLATVETIMLPVAELQPVGSVTTTCGALGIAGAACIVTVAAREIQPELYLIIKS